MMVYENTDNRKTQKRLFHFVMFLALGFACYQVALFVLHKLHIRHFEHCQGNLRRIGAALEMYSTDHAGHYPTDFSSLTPGYLRSVPVCPAAGVDTYSKSYEWMV